MALTERLDEKGLTQSDYEMRIRIGDKLIASPSERGSITKDLANWRKGWSKIVESSQKRFNKMRRMQCADDWGYCHCCCTGELIHYKGIDAGHFISATKQNTRFEPSNVHPQSKGSNQWDTTNDSVIDYTMFMVERYGRDHIDKLRAEAKESKSWGDHKEELLTLRLIWSREIKIQQKRLGE